MRFNVTNRTTSVRSFSGGGRYLTLAGGEVERGVELSKDEADALNATGEFYVREIESPPEDKPAAKPADDTKINLKP